MNQLLTGGMPVKEILSTITSKGQLTLPVEVRRHLGVTVNEKVVFVLEPGGGVRIETPRYRSVASLRGAAGSLKEPKPWQEVLDTAREDQPGGKLRRDRE